MEFWLLIQIFLKTINIQYLVFHIVPWVDFLFPVFTNSAIVYSNSRNIDAFTNELIFDLAVEFCIQDWILAFSRSRNNKSIFIYSSLHQYKWNESNDFFIYYVIFRHESPYRIQFVFRMNYQIWSDTMKAFLWASMLPFVLADTLPKNPESKCKSFAECHALGLSALTRIEAT